VIAAKASVLSSRVVLLHFAAASFLSQQSPLRKQAKPENRANRLLFHSHPEAPRSAALPNDLGLSNFPFILDPPHPPFKKARCPYFTAPRWRSRHILSQRQPRQALYKHNHIITEAPQHCVDLGSMDQQHQRTNRPLAAPQEGETGSISLDVLLGSRGFPVIRRSLAHGC